MELEIVGERILNMLFYSTDHLVGYVRMVIAFECSYVEVTVDNDTDELIVRTLGFKDFGSSAELIKAEDDLTLEISRRSVGKVVGSYWLAANNQGYSDLFALGIDEVVPSMIISSVASRLEVRWAIG